MGDEHGGTEEAGRYRSNIVADDSFQVDLASRQLVCACAWRLGVREGRA
jgi:hypothetical protein